MSNTFGIFGMHLPIIARLADGYVLVAHRNGPAIANAQSLFAIDALHDDFGPPEPIRHEAITAYRQWSWPLVRERLLTTERARDGL